MKNRDLLKITWRDPGHDWPWFRLIKTLPGGWLKIQGAENPHGSAKHQGDAMLVHKSDITHIEVFE